MAEPRRVRPRRSHAERTAETRGRILSAVVETIAEAGFPAATAVEITRRAGVTWGAVQHHFGGKDGMLVAVVEDSFAHFAARLEDVPRAGAVQRRVALFLERAWEHFGSVEYRSTFEILRSHLREVPNWQERMFHALDAVWMQLFGDAPIPRRRHFLLQHYTIAVLSGLSATLLLEGPHARLRPAELDLLADTLVRELQGAG